MRGALTAVAGVSLFSCCSLVMGLALIDQACLWDRLPIVYDVLRSLGYTAVCS
jgi:hypothetical protein